MTDPTQPTPLREAVEAWEETRFAWEENRADGVYELSEAGNALRDAALAEIARLTDRIEYLTVDCDQYVFWVRDERCHRADDGVVCPREPHCHDEDRRLSGRTPEHPSGRWTKIKEG